jgi:hypothetical protein
MLTGITFLRVCVASCGFMRLRPKSGIEVQGYRTRRAIRVDGERQSNKDLGESHSCCFV